MLRRPRLRSSSHDHPALVIRVSPTTVAVNFMSSDYELFDDNHDLTINTDDDGFDITGLDRKTYFIFGAVNEGPHAFFEGHLIGRIEGEIKQQVEDWWGEAIV